MSSAGWFSSQWQSDCSKSSLHNCTTHHMTSKNICVLEFPTKSEIPSAWTEIPQLTYSWANFCSWGHIFSLKHHLSHLNPQKELRAIVGQCFKYLTIKKTQTTTNQNTYQSNQNRQWLETIYSWASAEKSVSVLPEGRMKVRMICWGNSSQGSLCIPTPEGANPHWSTDVPL